jgi:flavin-dependent dehydrogenase
LEEINNDNPIKILGAGLSGLSAAITLARNRINVEVFEKRLHPGGRFKRDFQGLRNFGNSNKNPIEEFENIGIFLKPYKKLKRIITFSRSHSFEIYNDDNPIYYCVLRGKDENSIDRQLEKLANNYGVKICYNSTLNINDVDIVASGPRKADCFAYGAIYEDANFDDAGFVFLDKRYSPYGYLYILPGEKKGEVEVVNTVFNPNFKMRKIKTLFNIAIEKNEVLKDILNGSTQASIRRGIGCYTILDTFHYNNRYYVGEAAGLQDSTAGFGIRYAIISGYLAAQSILTGKNYDKLLSNYFKTQLEFEHARKKNFSKLTDKDIDSIFRSVNQKNGNILTLEEYRSLRGVI